MENIVFYGAGANGHQLVKFYPFLHPSCFVDKNPDKQGTTLDGIPILSLQAAKEKYGHLSVLVSPSPPLREEIEKELLLDPDITLLDLKEYTKLASVIVLTETPTSIELSRRLSDSYQKQCEAQSSTGIRVDRPDALWDTIFCLKLDIHKRLLEGNCEKLSEILSHPYFSNLFYGFDTLTQTIDNSNEESQVATRQLATMLYDIAAIWSGAIAISDKLDYIGSSIIYDCFISNIDLGRIIRELSRFCGHEIQFPNPYPCEIGIEITNSDNQTQVISYRALQALHQTFIIWGKLGRKPGRVLEIGAGLGRTAYFCKTLFNIDYTIIDLPLTQVASGHFLAQTLGEDTVCLYGEPYVDGQIRILPQLAFEDKSMTGFDLIVNVDSLTEMDFSTMKWYWEKIKSCSKAFLSVNHELNEHTVRELIVDDSAVKTYTRHFYELRRPYMEEYVTF